MEETWKGKTRGREKIQSGVVKAGEERGICESRRGEKKSARARRKREKPLRGRGGRNAIDIHFPLFF